MTNRTGQLPPEASFADVQLRIRKSITNPNVGKVSQVVLKEGPRSFKVATVFEILDPSSGDLHHNSLRLDHIDKTKAGWFARPARSFRVEAEELDDLIAFLAALADGKLAGRTGDLHIIGAEDYEQLANVVGMLHRLPTHDRVNLVASILSGLDASHVDVAQLVKAFASADRDVLATIAAASRLIEYEAVYDRLVELTEDPGTTELDLQRHLQTNPWMFGSEYSELLDRRTWTRDDRLDFMLRRTADGFLEIVEIKTAAVGPLFRHDAAHDSYYPSSDLSKVIGQTIRYISEIDRKRNAIIASDKVDPHKIRARIIVGRDGDAHEIMALRSLNAHLIGIEVLTYDQLLKIADRVLAVFRGSPDRRVQGDGDDAPF